jgi:hypothetical protein
MENDERKQEERDTTREKVKIALYSLPNKLH